MKVLGRLSALFLAMAFVMVMSGSVFAVELAVRLSDHKVIGFTPMIEELKGSRLIFVGEIHDRKEHHLAQLEVIKAFRQAGVPLAIGLEMFTAESQAELDRWVAGKIDLYSFIRLYYRQWEMPWPLYQDILLYARDNRIPLVGLNMPREIIRKVAQEGFAALTPDERKKLPAGINCNVDPAYKSFIRKAYEFGHLGNDKSFVHFCEAQMLWNKGMARRLQEFLLRNPARTVVVLAGVGHAMKRGTPAEVFGGTGYSYKVVLPELPEFERRAVTSEDADYLFLFGHAERPGE